MSLSKRSGINYLWHNDNQGRQQKISTESTAKKGALAFVRPFWPKESVTSPVEFVMLMNYFASRGVIEIKKSKTATDVY